MKYEEVLKCLYSRNGKSSFYTLRRIRRAADLLGNPQKFFPAVHITGSNGKGSVAKMVFEALHISGCKTALFTSPHLHTYTERMRIGRRKIPRSEVIKRFLEIEHLRIEGKMPWITFFEITTLMAFSWFAEEKVDIAVLEVGLGGRLDATNICSPLVSVITSIGFEHTNILGSTLREIAYEKAGIIKKGVPVVIGKIPSCAKNVIFDKARRLKSQVICLNRDFEFIENSDGTFDYRGSLINFKGAEIALAGRHQFHNAAVACATIEELIRQGYRIEADDVKRALKTVRWEGRMETFAGNPEIIFDCAHNYPAIKNLVSQFNGKKFLIVFGALKDKPIEKMIKLLKPIAVNFYISAPVVHRAPTLEELSKRCKHPVYDSVSNAFKSAVMEAKKTGLPVLVTGSVFVVAESRQCYLRLKNADPPVAM